MLANGLWICRHGFLKVRAHYALSLDMKCVYKPVLIEPLWLAQG